MEDKTMLFSRVNDQNSWALDTDEGVIRFASEEDCQRMMRLIQSKNASARPEGGVKREDIIEECARVCDLLAGLSVQGWGRKCTSAAQKCATEIRALK